MTPPATSAARWAMFTSAFMIAHHVAGKATRDALFLSNFAVTSLPVMVVCAAILSIAVALLFSRALSRLGPARVMSPLFLISGVLLVGEWLLFKQNVRVASVLVFLHVTAVSVVLISGFWSVINERFDPRAAKGAVGRIAGAGTVGGLLGGLGAERLAHAAGAAPALLMLAALHTAAALTLRFVTKHPTQADQRLDAPVRTRDAIRALRTHGYLRNLTLLVVSIAVVAGLIDYVFKSFATARFPGDADLMRFFALFHTSVALVTVLVQAGATSRMLERMGLARTITLHPVAVFVGGIGLLASPGLVVATLLRGVESIMATSFFRSAYELLFTPLPPKEKRASKSLIDVGADRLGDVLGGGFIALVLFAVPSVLEPVLIVTALLAAGFAIAITLRLHRGYVETLERNLLARAVTLDARDASDRTTRQALMHTMTVMDVPIAARRASSTAGDLRATEPKELDPVARDVAALRSGSAERVIGVLRAAPLEDESVASAIPLLAWDLVAADVTAALRNVAARHVGQLSDALLNPDNDFAIRRRVARPLSVVDSQRAIDALLLGLADRRFEVRRNCGHALATIHARGAEGLSFPADRVEDAVLNEATVSRRVWDGRRLLDDIDEEGIPFTDSALVERSNRSLEHVFTLLGLMLPTQPLVVAYRGLHTTDAALKGTALEYLESVLPPAVRSALWPYLEAPAKPKTRSSRTQAQILDDLIRSNHSIQLNLEEIRRRLR